MYSFIGPNQNCTSLEEIPDIFQNNQGNTSVQKKKSRYSDAKNIEVHARKQA